MYLCNRSCLVCTRCSKEFTRVVKNTTSIDQVSSLPGEVKVLLFFFRRMRKFRAKGNGIGNADLYRDLWPVSVHIHSDSHSLPPSLSLSQTHTHTHTGTHTHTHTHTQSSWTKLNRPRALSYAYLTQCLRWAAVTHRHRGRQERV